MNALKTQHWTIPRHTIFIWVDNPSSEESVLFIVLSFASHILSRANRLLFPDFSSVSRRYIRSRRDLLRFFDDVDWFNNSPGRVKNRNLLYTLTVVKCCVPNLLQTISSATKIFPRFSQISIIHLILVVLIVSLPSFSSPNECHSI